MEKGMKKVIPIYEAVISLINEGISIPEIKVSDISKRAGIGKGTVYEYFSTKEQVIAEALLYSVQVELEVLSQTLESKPSFREKYEEIIRWLDNMNISEVVLVSIFKLTHDSNEMMPSMKREMMEQMDKWEVTDRLLHSLFEALRRDANVSDSVDDFRLHFAICSQLGSYMMTSKCNSKVMAECQGSLGELTYENIIKMVS